MSDDRLRFGLDSNVLVYAVDLAAGARSDRAGWIIRAAAETGRCTLALQSIGEFYRAATRKRRLAPEAAACRAGRLMDVFPVAEARALDARLALAEARAGRFSYWDALLLLTLGRAGCKLVLSEDMQDGGTLGGIRICNPFLGDAPPDEVAALLRR